jgi:hypothetical protein
VRSIALPSLISSTLRSILNSVRHGRSTDHGDAASGNKNVWYPLSEQRRNFVSAKTVDSSEMGMVDAGGIHVERGFSTDVMSKNSATSV